MDRPKSFLEYKGFDVNFKGESLIKDIDEKTGKVVGYFAVFGNVDSDGDMIMPGAFKKTLEENYRRVKHLWQHDPLYPLSATKNERLKVYEDGYGLKYESQISQTSYGKDAIQLHKDGVIDENSIGFNTIRQQKAKGYNEIIEVKLWEGSAVTWAANPMAQTESIKSMTKEQLFTKMNTVLKALRNGTYENDEIFEVLEYSFKQLQQRILELTESSTHAATPVAPEPPKGEEFKSEDVVRIYSQLKTNLKFSL